MLWAGCRIEPQWQWQPGRRGGPGGPSLLLGLKVCLSPHVPTDRRPAIASPRPGRHLMNRARRRAAPRPPLHGHRVSRFSPLCSSLGSSPSGSPRPRLRPARAPPRRPPTPRRSPGCSRGRSPPRRGPPSCPAHFRTAPRRPAPPRVLPTTL